MAGKRIAKLWSRTTEALGSNAAILIAFSILILWGLSGPFLDWSNTWQLLINTATTISTGLMVFIILNTENRNDRAVQTKLDAILEALSEVDESKLTSLEDLPEKDIKIVQDEVHRSARQSSDTSQ